MESENLEKGLEDLKLQGQEEQKQPTQVHPATDEVTVDYVSNLTEPTDKFLCKLSDNWPKFKFAGFKIRDCVSNITLVDVPESDVDEEATDEDGPDKRVI